MRTITHTRQSFSDKHTHTHTHTQTHTHTHTHTHIHTHCRLMHVRFHARWGWEHKSKRARMLTWRLLARCSHLHSLLSTPYPLLSSPYTLSPTSCCLLPSPYSMLKPSAPCFPIPTPDTLNCNPTPDALTLHPPSSVVCVCARAVAQKPIEDSKP